MHTTVKHFLTVLLVTSTALLSEAGIGQDIPFVNWENTPIHPIDLSPDGTRLAVAHTADARLEIFSVTTGVPVSLASIPVGLDPISVRFRTDNEVWVVNHISDSISIVDLAHGRVIDTLQTDDEPADVVFAGSDGKAFVSCSQSNTIMVFDPTDNSSDPQRIAINAEDPRALATSPDGLFVYAAIFESGNATTVLGGGLETDSPVSFPANIVNDGDTPYAGINPPPNNGNIFEPSVNQDLPPAPPVGLIVRKNDQGQWLDDNQTDWTAYVSGELAGRSNRPIGWDLPDRDIARIDTRDLSLDYVRSLMNIGMTLAVNPVDGGISLVGTDATNQVRFEPMVNGTFVRVQMATVTADDLNDKTINDLNGHLNYQSPSIAQAQRDLSVGDPRGAIWNAAGTRLYITGMGSNNLIVVNRDGQRVSTATSIETGTGPTGIVMDDARQRAYVWNHFDKSISVIDILSEKEITRTAVFDPTPAVISEGRPFLYDTHLTSGLGQASCGACHVDARIDRLAWDLGDPGSDMLGFQQNCLTSRIRECEDFHPMKGPMITQTLQDIIGNEPFHWRGDRAGIEEFNPAFEGLLGDDTQLSADEMQRFEDFLATITFPPNPFRNLDNSLPADLPLPGHFATGRFAAAGTPLPNGNASRGLSIYRFNLTDGSLQCASCHTLPTGMGANSVLRSLGVRIGGMHRPTGLLGENSLGIVSIDGSSNVSIKIPQLRNLYEKVGFDATQQESRAGFGFLHDGTVDSIARFVNLQTFDLNTVQDTADLVALMLAFSGSDLPAINLSIDDPAPISKDSHAAVGQQVKLIDSNNTRLDLLASIAAAGRIGLIADTATNNGRRGWTYDPESNLMLSDNSDAALTISELRADATETASQTWTAVPAEVAVRLGIDRDMNGTPNGEESMHTLSGGFSGAWFDPSHDGEGLLIEILDNNRGVASWFTYDGEGNQRWHTGVGPIIGDTLIFESLQAPIGGIFGDDFDPASVQRLTSGAAAVRFNHCNSADLYHQVDGVLNIQNLVRLTSIAGLSCNGDPGAAMGISGSWFDPDHDGEGFVVQEISATQALVAWYSYDNQGNQAWFSGVGTLDGQRIIVDQVRIPSGGIFGPEFDPSTVVANPWGRIELELGCSTGAIDYISSISSFGSGSQNLTRLTTPSGVTCATP